MRNIATLTMNPTIDVSFDVDNVHPTHKIRGRNERHDPGGGGINVARMFVRLGGNARCFYLAGGATGEALDGLLDLHQLVRARVPIRGETRVSTSIFESLTGEQYRFVTNGPVIQPNEWQHCLALLAQTDCEYLVASGSLPEGVPQDFYARIISAVAGRGIRVVLDSSGAALEQGLAGGCVYLVKPSIGELSTLVGRELIDERAIAEAAQGIVQSGQAEHVAVTLGSDGALLANAAGNLRLPAIPVKAASAVGAGDSFLAATLYALATDRDLPDAFRFGLAAGAAAALTQGTDLARPEDIHRLFAEAAQLAPR
ncbi:1-phosphofructokinase family hexose kinase [Altererythrobacter sp. SALINAS58]|uniref:1-phosphofructokinase family hexose kinase n=1 Tax=Alteripontixanthobacter muriae TaxID=2705546 RepID=UPI00157768B4|nr:1-phosphofructokinase family hexose kinase [Alteripontixanthobacter muriae]NTZ44002.1 1-phosphofructokinase family hexose kinase [Alteripontixanthobacter muriae]